MCKIIDLSHTIEDLMPVYPGDDDTRLLQSRKLTVHGYNNHKLETGMHSGTHLDGPMHLTESNIFIWQMPLEKFIGKGCVLDVSGQNKIIYKKDYEDKIAENDIVLLYTGFDKKFHSDEYFDNHPVIDVSLAELFIRKKIKILGLDFPSPDRHPFLVHKLLFNNNILIIENLTNVDKLLAVAKFEVIAFPLKINADSSILRAAARCLM